jgi:hypothetical protein
LDYCSSFGAKNSFNLVKSTVGAVLILFAFVYDSFGIGIENEM